MSKAGGHNPGGPDRGGGPLATVHELDAVRARHEEGVSPAPTAPNEPPTIDRAAALNMLSTFDLDGIEVPSPDDVLAGVDAEAVASRSPEPPPHRPADDRGVGVDVAAIDVGDTDAILQELEEHHRRAHQPARTSTPRGSADLQPGTRRRAPAARSQNARRHAPAGPRRRRPRRVALVLGAVLAVTAASGTFALSQLLGSAARPTRLGHTGAITVAAEISPLASTTVFRTLANLFTAGGDVVRDNKRAGARPRRRAATRKRTARHGPVHHAASAQVVSTPPPSSSSSSSGSSSAPSPSTQSATSASAPVATSQRTQPAFGQNGSLGPGRGASSTQ